MTIQAKLLCAVAVTGFAAFAATAPAQALTTQECSAKYQAAKSAGTLNGQKWNDFRKAQCSADATPAAAPAAAPAPAPVPAAAREVTGSVSQPTTVAAAAPVVPPKPEVGRLPRVEGWVLRDVGNGGALIEGRRGMFEVYIGDPLPGLGRVDAIRKQDGQWVVVTTKGLIMR